MLPRFPRDRPAATSTVPPRPSSEIVFLPAQRQAQQHPLPHPNNERAQVPEAREAPKAR
jgi:hypothetical protein